MACPLREKSFPVSKSNYQTNNNLQLRATSKIGRGESRDCSVLGAREQHGGVILYELPGQPWIKICIACAQEGVEHPGNSSCWYAGNRLPPSPGCALLYCSRARHPHGRGEKHQASEHFLEPKARSCSSSSPPWKTALSFLFSSDVSWVNRGKKNLIF